MLSSSFDSWIKPWRSPPWRNGSNHSLGLFLLRSITSSLSWSFWHLQSAHRTSLHLKNSQLQSLLNSATAFTAPSQQFLIRYHLWLAALVRSALCARVMWYMKRRTQYLKQNKFILHAMSDQLQAEPADPETAVLLITLTSDCRRLLLNQE